MNHSPITGVQPLSFMVQIEAVIRLCIDKDVFTPEELIDEVKAVHAEQHKPVEWG